MGTRPGCPKRQQRQMARARGKREDNCWRNEKEKSFLFANATFGFSRTKHWEKSVCMQLQMYSKTTLLVGQYTRTPRFGKAASAVSYQRQQLLNGERPQPPLLYFPLSSFRPPPPPDPCPKKQEQLSPPSPPDTHFLLFPRPKPKTMGR